MQRLFEGNRHKTASAPLVAILSADIQFHEELPQLLPHLPDKIVRQVDHWDGRRNSVANGKVPADQYPTDLGAAAVQESSAH